MYPFFFFFFFIARCTNECSQLIPARFLETILSHVEILFGAICHGKTGQNLLFITRHNCQAGCITEVEEITEIPTGGGDTLLDKPVGFRQLFHSVTYAIDYSDNKDIWLQY